MSGEHDDLAIAPPPRRVACQHIDWRNLSGPDDMPEMRAYCGKLRQFLPERKEDRDTGLCMKCILYEAHAPKAGPR